MNEAMLWIVGFGLPVGIATMLCTPVRRAVLKSVSLFFKIVRRLSLQLIAVTLIAIFFLAVIGMSLKIAAIIVFISLSLVLCAQKDQVAEKILPQERIDFPPIPPRPR